MMFRPIILSVHNKPIYFGMIFLQFRHQYVGIMLSKYQSGLAMGVAITGLKPSAVLFIIVVS